MLEILKKIRDEIKGTFCFRFSDEKVVRLVISNGSIKNASKKINSGIGITRYGLKNNLFCSTSDLQYDSILKCAKSLISEEDKIFNNYATNFSFAKGDYSRYAVDTNDFLIEKNMFLHEIEKKIKIAIPNSSTYITLITHYIKK